MRVIMKIRYHRTKVQNKRKTKITKKHNKIDKKNNTTSLKTDIIVIQNNKKSEHFSDLQFSQANTKIKQKQDQDQKDMLNFGKLKDIQRQNEKERSNLYKSKLEQSSIIKKTNMINNKKK